MLYESKKTAGRTPHGVRGLKSQITQTPIAQGGSRTPHGVRGLKSDVTLNPPVCDVSHPAWGAWIEIRVCRAAAPGSLSRTPHGVRGLKYPRRWPMRSCARRTPHGVRGLKSENPIAEMRYSKGRTPHGVRGLKSL